MSPFIILSAIFILYMFSKPRFLFFLNREGAYLTRDWCSFVNALFISLVVCSHGLNLFQTNIRGYFIENFAVVAVNAFGQLMVTTFFFFSGYGIMLSLLNRGGYATKLIFPRFVKICLNFCIAVAIYFIVHCILHAEINWSCFLGGLHSFSVLGNPTWFILMTLLSYVIAYVCFILTGKKRPYIFIFSLTSVLVISIYLINKVKPDHWVNTVLCFPAGMLYYLKGAKLEALLKKTRLPSIAFAIVFMIMGRVMYSLHAWPNIYTENMGGILFALGATWFFGSFSWQRPSRFLIWLGGSGLFVVYMFHLLPMKILTHFGINNANAYLVWFIVISSSAILALVAGQVFKKLDRLLSLLSISPSKSH